MEEKKENTRYRGKFMLVTDYPGKLTQRGNGEEKTLIKEENLCM